uniref:Transcription factor-like protein DPB n=1 Tax=Anthurium amnicola TaxID=1678845 RepID=A0A1D1YM94_9ARAE
MGLPHATPVPPSATTDLHHGGGRDDTRVVPSIDAGGTPHAGVSPPPARHFADPPRSPFMSSGKMKKRSAHQASVDKNGRGLRQFSMKVCENVESKGVTTHNEVANELVAEFADPSGNLVSPDQQQYEDKNIRRRVYDALNVLIAMDIISRDKKEIKWKGLPCTSPNDDQALKVECSTRRNRIEKKAAYLEELVEQYIGLQNLVERNERLYNSEVGPSAGIALPFILAQTHPRATVEVEISEDMQLVHFDFNRFQLIQDIKHL